MNDSKDSFEKLHGSIKGFREHFKPLYDLTVESGPLAMMINAQKELQYKIDERSGHLTEPVEKQAIFYTLALMMESAEIMDRLPFKHWKKYSKEDIESMLKSLDLAEEIIDCLHFIFNLWLCLGYDEKDLYVMYRVKNAMNQKRQEENY